MSYFSKVGSALRRWSSPQALYSAAVQHRVPHEKMTAPKRQRHFSRLDGPMYFLGQQIVKGMQDAGFPATIEACFKTPEQVGQDPFEETHLLCEAVDIVHMSKGRDVSQDFWDTLHACATIVSDKYRIGFVMGYDCGFDPAHIELKDWHKAFRRYRQSHIDQLRYYNDRKDALLPVGPRPTVGKPSEGQLWQRFIEVLPDEARSFTKRKTGIVPFIK